MFPWQWCHSAIALPITCQWLDSSLIYYGLRGAARVDIGNEDIISTREAWLVPPLSDPHEALLLFGHQAHFCLWWELCVVPTLCMIVIVSILIADKKHSFQAHDCLYIQTILILQGLISDKMCLLQDQKRKQTRSNFGEVEVCLLLWTNKCPWKNAIDMRKDHVLNQKFLIFQKCKYAMKIAFFLLYTKKRQKLDCFQLPLSKEAMVLEPGKTSPWPRSPFDDAWVTTRGFGTWSVNALLCVLERLLAAAAVK